VKRLIDWRSAQSKYSAREQNIKAVADALRSLLGAKGGKGGSKTGAKHRFLRNYRNQYRSSALVLYQGMVDDSSLLSGNLVKAAVKYTQNHRRQVQRFMLGLLQLIMQGIQIEMSFYSMTENKAYVDYRKGEWQTKISQVRSVMQKTDKKIVSGWKKQLVKDIDQLLKEHSGQSNKEFSETVYKFLMDKYDWRSWFVVVSNAVTGEKRHWHGYCDGHKVFRRNGRNIVVASRLLSKRSRHDTSRAKSILSTLARNANDLLSTYPKSLYNALPASARKCSQYVLRSFVCSNCGVEYSYPKGQCTSQKLTMSFILFGSYNVIRKNVNSILCS